MRTAGGRCGAGRTGSRWRGLHFGGDVRPSPAIIADIAIVLIGLRIIALCLVERRTHHVLLTRPPLDFLRRNIFSGFNPWDHAITFFTVLFITAEIMVPDDPAEDPNVSVSLTAPDRNLGNNFVILAAMRVWVVLLPVATCIRYRASSRETK